MKGGATVDYSLPQRLQDYIEAEQNDEALYRAMADIAPNEEERRIFLEIAENERRHADSFLKIYLAMTGQNYTPRAYPRTLEGPYRFALRQLLLNEHRTFQEYHRQFMKTDNMELKSVCYEAGRNKSTHIQKLISLMTRD